MRVRAIDVLAVAGGLAWGSLFATSCVSSHDAILSPRGAPRGTPLPGQEILAIPGVNLTCCVTQDEWGRCIRNDGRRRLFVQLTGGDRPGLYVNHIVPLRCGGCDVPANLEWMTKAAWAGRTGAEAKDCGRHAGGEW